MAEAIDTRRKITRLVDLLKACGLRIDARVVETVPRSPTEAPVVTVEIFGEDSAMFLHNDGELLLAVQHLAAEMLRIPRRDGGLLRFGVGPQPRYPSDTRV